MSARVLLSPAGGQPAKQSVGQMIGDAVRQNGGEMPIISPGCELFEIAKQEAWFLDHRAQIAKTN